LDDSKLSLFVHFEIHTLGSAYMKYCDQRGVSQLYRHPIQMA